MEAYVYIHNGKVTTDFKPKRGTLIAKVPIFWRVTNPRTTKQIISCMFRVLLSHFDERFICKSNYTPAALAHYWNTEVLYPTYWTSNLTELMSEKRATLTDFVLKIMVM